MSNRRDRAERKRNRETEAERDERIREMLSRAGDPEIFHEEVSEAEIAKVKREALVKLAESGAILNDDQRALAHAVNREMNARANLDLVIDAMIAHYFDNNTSLMAKLAKEARIYKDMLARALRDQGRLDEAIEVVPEYAEKLEVGRAAIDRPDDWECDCADPILPVYNDAGARVGSKCVSKWQIRKRIMTEKHGRYVYFVQCGVCLEHNARPDLPPALAAQLALGTEPPLIRNG